MSPLTHDDYTVAWICALPIEMAAAKTMLDEIHSTPLQPNTDSNTYTLGKLSGHNVVVVCLPSGMYGTTSAATVLTHMLRTFYSIQFGLMVGIGGGVPQEQADIRVGDVVVSTPNATSGGVVQYDFGKALRDGRFQRTGWLNKPPSVLLTAVSQMRSNALLRETQIHSLVLSALRKSEEIRRQFSRPAQDWLFHATYNHHGSHLDCSACDKNQLVHRSLRASDEPYIHYGSIASGNRVVKDAKLRDSLSQELGILCFDMEAAGLMDQLPSLVIRGICDYSDTHKNKQWQGYAALVAAAYAKALLTAVPLRKSDREPEGKLMDQSPWMVPFPRNFQFTGQDHAMARLEALVALPREVSRVAICGAAGVGKSEVALELAYRVRSLDAERSIFWVSCTTYQCVQQTFGDIIQLLRMSNVKPVEAAEQLMAYLSEPRAGKWLLIFDNADNSDIWIKGNSTIPALKNFLPQNEQGQTLFITRDENLAASLAYPYVIQISRPERRTSVGVPEDVVGENQSVNYTTREETVNQTRRLSLLAKKNTRQVLGRILSTNFAVIVRRLNDIRVQFLFPDMDRGYFIDLPGNTLVYLALIKLIGSICAYVANIHVCARLGTGGTLVLGATIELLGYSLLFWDSPLPLFMSGVFLTGMGAAFQDVQTKKFTTTIKHSYRWLAILHAVYGVGSVINEMIVGVINSCTPSWHHYYRTTLALNVANTVLLYSTFRDDLFRPDMPNAKTTASGELRATLSDHVVWIFTGHFICLEIWLNWIPSALINFERQHGASLVNIAIYSIGTGLAFGSIGLTEIIHLFGERHLVFLYIALAMATQLTSWLVPNMVVNLFTVCILGFCIGPFYPMGLYVLAKSIPHELHTGAIVLTALLTDTGSWTFKFIGQFSLTPSAMELMVVGSLGLIGVTVFWAWNSRQGRIRL